MWCFGLFCVYVICGGPKFLDWRGGLDVEQEKKQAEVQDAEEEEQIWTWREKESRQHCGCLLLIQK